MYVVRKANHLKHVNNCKRADILDGEPKFISILESRLHVSYYHNTVIVACITRGKKRTSNIQIRKRKNSRRLMYEYV